MRNVAKQRYYSRLWPAMGAHVALALIAKLVMKQGHPHEAAVVYGLAVLPALPLLVVLGITGMYLMEEPDEFERTVMVQSMLWAMGGVLGLTSVWGLLEMFAENTPHQMMVVGHLQPFWLFPLFWMLMGMATPLVRWRYR